MAQENEEVLTEESPLINRDTVMSELSTPPFRITMELPLFVSLLGISLSSVAVTNIIMYRTCVHSLGHSNDECSTFLTVEKANKSRLEVDVEKYATFVTTVKSVIESLVPALLSFFLGVWSDTHGRKPLVVWPLMGLSANAMLIVVYSMLDNLGPWWYLLTIVPFSLSGGFTVMFTGAYCYMSDITTTKRRSLRMTIMQAAVSAGSVVGSLSSSYLMRAVGNVNLLLIVACFNVAAYVYTNLWVQESIRGALEGSITTVLDFLLVKEMIHECFKRRPNKGRAQILLLTLANSLVVFIAFGIISLEYYYTREKLQWSMKDYTLFSAMHTTISFVGGFFGIIVVQRLFGISDLAFANIAFFSSVMEFTTKASAVVTWHMYLSSVLSIFRSLSSPLLRSFITKILPLTDISKVFALMSAIEGICPVLSPIIYNSLYVITIDDFPGAIYVLSIAVTFVSIFCVGFVQYYRRNVSTPYERLADG